MRPCRLFCVRLLACSVVAISFYAGCEGAGAQLTATAGSDSTTLTTQARALLAAGDTENATKVLRQAIDASPNAPEANLMLGELYASELHYPDAMERFEKVLAIDLRNQRARRGELEAATRLALQARAAGRQEAALLCLQHAREALPDDPDLLTDLGIQAQSMHLLKPAAEALNAALAVKPDDLQALYALARVEADQDRLPEAEQHMRRYLEARPVDATAHYGLGQLLERQQRPEEAKAEFQRSIAIQPVQTESYYQLGQIALDARHDEEARAMFQKCLARSGTHGGALAGMGIIAFREKQFEEARKYLAAATEASPEYQPAHYYLGLTLDRMGDKAAGQRELQVAAELARRQQGKGDPVPTADVP